MDNKGYYKTLGVAENASDEDIKKAYRSGAIKWHPDRWVNGTEEEKKTAEENFKKLNEAYSVLSDKEKRNAYDMGMDGNFQQGQGFNPFDIFKEHFNNMGNFGGFNFGFGGNPFGGQSQQTVKKGDDINVTISLTMAEANKGVKKDITIETHEECEFCHGSGFGQDGGMQTCPHCQGTGVLKQVKQTGYMTIVNTGPCPYCHGTGFTVKNPCTHCGGTGLSKDTKKETISVNIPVGVAPGETVVFQGRGDYPTRKDGVRGNLNITIDIHMPDGYSFTNNLGGVECELNVPFYDAILGCEKTILFPSGDMKKIKIDRNTNSGTVYSFKNEGMKLKDGKARTAFDVVVNYSIPKKLSKKQEEILKEFKNITENGN